MKRRILVSAGIAVLLLAALAANVHAAEVKITASDGVADDHFGRSVAISGDYAVVGTLGADDNVLNSGSAYIYTIGASVSEPYVFTTADAVIALQIAVGSSPYDPHWDVSGNKRVTSPSTRS